MNENFSQHMTNDPTNALRYVKLKYGVAELEDHAPEIDERTYFITTFTPETASFVKELIRIFKSTRKEKSLKSRLVILGTTKEMMPELSKEDRDVIVFAEPKEEKETALLLYGSIALISLLYEAPKESFYLEVMKLGVPLVLPHIESTSAIGHAAFFLEKINDENVEAALLKLENSATLRESIVKSALEQIRSAQ